MADNTNERLKAIVLTINEILNTNIDSEKFTGTIDIKIECNRGGITSQEVNGRFILRRK
jgi:hypothetical protein